MLWWQEKRRDFLEPNKRKDVGMSFFLKVAKLESARKIGQKRKGVRRRKNVWTAARNCKIQIHLGERNGLVYLGNSLSTKVDLIDL